MLCTSKLLLRRSLLVTTIVLVLRIGAFCEAHSKKYVSEREKGHRMYVEAGLDLGRFSSRSKAETSAKTSPDAHEHTPSLRRKRRKATQVPTESMLTQTSNLAPNMATDAEYGRQLRDRSFMILDSEELMELTAAMGDMSFSFTTNAPTPAVSSMSPTSSPVVTSTTSPSVAPFDCVGDFRRSVIFSILDPISGPPLNQTGTPQNLAVNWVIDDNVLVADPCSSPEVVIQRYALATLYYGFNGDDWSVNTAWLTTANECGWFGVDCDDSGIVASLDLSSNNLSGQIQPELSSLVGLMFLSVFNNNIEGGIPATIGTMPALTFLDLEDNNLAGELFFDELFDLSDTLESFLVSNNFFTGTLDVRIGQLSSLSRFFVANNELEGPIPDIFGSLVNLSSVFIYDNNFVGPLPSSLFSSSQLMFLDASNNVLDGSIPVEAYSATSLQRLVLSNTGLSGPLDLAIGNWVNMEFLFLDNNLLTGNLPNTIVNLVNLVDLVLIGNFFRGPLPLGVGSMTSLRTFEGTGNAFAGRIPGEFFTIPTLEFLYLSNNTLAGPLPANYDEAESLVDLWLDGNLLQGPVADPAPGTLQNFEEFLLQRNSFTGTIAANSNLCALNLRALQSDCLAPAEIICECCTSCF